MLSQECDDVYAQHVHFAKRCEDKSIKQECPLGEKRKKSRVFIFQVIISAEDFDRTRELSVNPISILKGIKLCMKSKDRCVIKPCDNLLDFKENTELLSRKLICREGIRVMDLGDLDGGAEGWLPLNGSGRLSSFDNERQIEIYNLRRPKKETTNEIEIYSLQ
ncbi:hypothetical protein E5676_scaffold543G00050 [Cucumis melo var. makuwa]|uniref:Uncharacterized protein n=1 Tax=Cucumis melo var. makuwa TaxID=1194695 RepID=A0A5D3DF33_CUCMM|nr:hypothetical protein E5676_scaffold543G00050 [Cucumis melo var. makuwa]